jgi:hypothetical protein
VGNHSAESSKLREAWYWLVTHRRKVASAVIVALPFVSRFVPDFPTDDVVKVLRVFLGA